MGVAALVIGIVSLIVGFIPFCGTWAMLPAVVGLILGIVDTVLRSGRKQPRGMSIAGIVLNALAMLIIVVWWALAFSRLDMTNAMQQTGFSQQYPPSAAPGAQPGFGPAQQPRPAPSGLPMQPMQPMQPVQPAPQPAPTQ